MKNVSRTQGAWKRLGRSRQMICSSDGLTQIAKVMLPRTKHGPASLLEFEENAVVVLAAPALKEAVSCADAFFEKHCALLEKLEGADPLFIQLRMALNLARKAA